MPRLGEGDLLLFMALGPARAAAVWEKAAQDPLESPYDPPPGGVRGGPALPVDAPPAPPVSTNINQFPVPTAPEAEPDWLARNWLPLAGGLGAAGLLGGAGYAYWKSREQRRKQQQRQQEAAMAAVGMGKAAADPAGVVPPGVPPGVPDDEPSLDEQRKILALAGVLGLGPTAAFLGGGAGGLYGAATSQPGRGVRDAARGGLVGAATGAGAVLGGGAGLFASDNPLAAVGGAVGGGVGGNWLARSMLGPKDDEPRKAAAHPPGSFGSEPLYKPVPAGQRFEGGNTKIGPGEFVPTPLNRHVGGTTWRYHMSPDGGVDPLRPVDEIETGSQPKPNPAIHRYGHAKADPGGPGWAERNWPYLLGAAGLGGLGYYLHDRARKPKPESETKQADWVLDKTLAGLGAVGDWAKANPTNAELASATTVMGLFGIPAAAAGRAVAGAARARKGYAAQEAARGALIGGAAGLGSTVGGIGHAVGGDPRDLGTGLLVRALSGLGAGYGMSRLYRPAHEADEAREKKERAARGEKAANYPVTGQMVARPQLNPPGVVFTGTVAPPDVTVTPPDPQAESLNPLTDAAVPGGETAPGVLDKYGVPIAAAGGAAGLGGLGYLLWKRRQVARAAKEAAEKRADSIRDWTRAKLQQGEQWAYANPLRASMLGGYGAAELAAVPALAGLRGAYSLAAAPKGYGGHMAARGALIGGAAGVGNIAGEVANAALHDRNDFGAALLARGAGGVGAGLLASHLLPDPVEQDAARKYPAGASRLERRALRREVYGDKAAAAPDDADYTPPPRLGPLEALAAARAAGHEAPYEAKHYAASRYSAGGMPLRGAWARYHGALAGGRQLSEATKYVSKPVRWGSAALGDTGAELSDNLLESLATFGDPANLDKARAAYAARLAAYRDEPQAAPASAEALRHATEDVTPRTVMNASDVVARDHDVAAHRYNRANRPFHYWLNPFVSSGPITEIADRLARRGAAEKADPDAAFRASLYVPGVPTLRGLLGGHNPEKREKARALAAAAVDAANGGGGAKVAGFRLVKRADDPAFWRVDQHAENFANKLGDRFGSGASANIKQQFPMLAGAGGGGFGKFLENNNWATGALIGAPVGAGIGLLGGMFNRKKKRNALGDALTGGLLGLGGGALAGGAYDLLKDFNKTDDKPPPAPPLPVDDPDKLPPGGKELPKTDPTPNKTGPGLAPRQLGPEGSGANTLARRVWEGEILPGNKVPWAQRWDSFGDAFDMNPQAARNARDVVQPVADNTYRLQNIFARAGNQPAYDTMNRVGDQIAGTDPTNPTKLRADLTAATDTNLGVVNELSQYTRDRWAGRDDFETGLAAAGGLPLARSVQIDSPRDPNYDWTKIVPNYPETPDWATAAMGGPLSVGSGPALGRDLAGRLADEAEALRPAVEREWLMAGPENTGLDQGDKAVLGSTGAHTVYTGLGGGALVGGTAGAARQAYKNWFGLNPGVVKGPYRSFNPDVTRQGATNVGELLAAGGAKKDIPLPFPGPQSVTPTNNTQRGFFGRQFDRALVGGKVVTGFGFGSAAQNAQYMPGVTPVTDLQGVVTNAPLMGRIQTVMATNHPELAKTPLTADEVNQLLNGKPVTRTITMQHFQAGRPFGPPRPVTYTYQPLHLQAAVEGVRAGGGMKPLPGGVVGVTPESLKAPPVRTRSPINAGFRGAFKGSIPGLLAGSVVQAQRNPVVTPSWVPVTGGPQPFDPATLAKDPQGYNDLVTSVSTRHNMSADDARALLFRNGIKDPSGRYVPGNVASPRLSPQTFTADMQNMLDEMPPGNLPAAEAYVAQKVQQGLNPDHAKLILDRYKQTKDAPAGGLSSAQGRADLVRRRAQDRGLSLEAAENELVREGVLR